MRGFGANQAAFAIEGIMDRLAEKVGIDGWEMRPPDFDMTKKYADEVASKG